MHRLFNIIIIIILITSCSNKDTRVTKRYDDGSTEWLIEYSSKSDTSDKVIKGLYADGSVKCTKAIKNEKLHGQSVIYSPSGTIESIETYKNGILEGLVKKYNVKGELIAVGNCSDGFKQGKWEYVTSDGTRMIRRYHNDTLIGQTKEIRVNGNVVFGQYSNGKETGQWTTKSADSIVLMTSTYDGSIRNGKTKSFYLSGELYIEGYYLNDLKDSIWNIYNINGTIDTVEYYRNDTLVKVEIK